jgi:hypothetical protein
MASDFESKKAERILIEQEIANEFKGTPDMFSPGGCGLTMYRSRGFPLEVPLLAAQLGFSFSSTCYYSLAARP